MNKTPPDPVNAPQGSAIQAPPNHSVPLNARPVSRLRGVGPHLATKLKKLDIETIEDLLFHLPHRYQDRTRITPIGALRPGMEVLLQGEVVIADIVIGKRRSLLVKIQDGTGTLTLRFFHFSAAQKNQFEVKSSIRCYGEVRNGAHQLELVHPEYQLFQGDPPPLTDALTPIYPLTEGITQQRIRSLMDQALAQMSRQSQLVELLPEALLKQYQLSSLQEAVRLIHRPPASLTQSDLDEGRSEALKRLVFEELMAHHMSLLRVRFALRAQQAPDLAPNEASQHLKESFLSQLGFHLTNAQQRVGIEIDADLAVGHPMLRLVQGDVGSGKTIVAAMAALSAIAHGYQVALMAPTEILAEQHFNQFQRWFEPLNIKCSWLSGKLTAKQKRENLAKVADGDSLMIVGTHALFQEHVEFKSLGLVIIDEQHRFGVHQRLALKEKGKSAGLIPHQLIMTATPIPRTLAMSAYVDLDHSIIDELPPGRTPIQTIVVSEKRRAEVVARVRNACAEKKQVYWVCTLIEESEVLQCQAAEATEAELKEALPELNIGLVHGRMKPAEKSQVMDAFKQGDLDLLVATTVIEVGVDVPNASLMIIENPERLGLAQLHQLRGRVGRGSVASFCVLLYKTPLSRHGKERLKVMRETSNGFLIAEKDLELRGPGEVLGTRQTGEMTFRIADLERDSWLLDPAKTAAEAILSDYPNRCEPLIKRWLAHSEKYGFV